MPVSTATGIKINYDIVGRGPAMVLVHANPYDRRLWMFQAARFSQFFTVVSIDIRGYGLSDKPTAPFTLEDMAGDVLGVCKTEGIDKAIVGGCSVGSGIALLIGLDRPDLAQALVLVGGSSRGGDNVQKRIDGFLSGDLPAYRHRYIPELFAPGFTDTKHGRWVLNMFDENSHTLSAECIAQIFRARGGCNMTPRLGELKMPVLVINGEHDGSMPGGTETARLIPGARHAIIPGTGHACSIEDPMAFDAPLIEFLKDNRLWPA
ncbi:MAG: alpha/beta fold hydrolase [Alphaproteobacteria bacterium]